MPREIKTTIAVDGEQAFKRAINEANTSMRNLGTQLTLAQAQFKKDGDAMKLMESRSKTLAAEIGQQENIVKALEKAVEDSSKAYGENSEKTEKWEAELNRAKAKLVSLQSELTLNDQGLDRNGKAFDESSQAAADYQATLQTIGKNVSFETVTSGIHNITGVIEGAIKKVFSFAKAIRETFADAGEWADALMTDATKYGMDVETLQAWQNAADFIDTDVNTIITARDKLGQKMKKGWKDGDINMWEMLGIDLKDAETGKWRDKMDVMWEVGETLMSMARIDGDDVRADAYAQEVFGKSWRELLPLFVAGRKEWEKTVAEQQVVSEERVKALGELDDANQALANSWDVTKYSFLAELAPVVTDVTEAVTEMLQAFNEWMDTDEGKQAMQELSEAIQELFSGLKDVSFKDAIDAVKGAIEGIKDALVWMDEHKNDVVTALEIIAGGFALLKVTELALNIGKIVSGFQTLWAGANNPLPSLPGTGTNGPVTTTGSPTTTGTDTTTAAAGGGLLSRILSSPVAKAIGGAGAFLWAMSPDNPLFAQSGSNDLFDANGNPTQEFWANGDYYMKDRLQALHDRYNIGLTDIMDDQDLMNLLFGNKFETDEGLFGYLENQMGWKPYEEPKAELPEGQANLYADPDAPIYHKDRRTGEMHQVLDTYSDEMMAAAEKFWDVYRGDWGENDEKFDAAWDEFEAAFKGNAELFDALNDKMDEFVQGVPDDSWKEQEDIPKEWFQQSSEDLGASTDLMNDAVAQLKTNVESGKTVAQTVAGMDIKRFNGLPAELQVAAQRGTAAGVSGIRVYLDGATVGRLVAPYVNAALGSMTV